MEKSGDIFYFTEAERVLLRKQRKIVICGEIDAGCAHDFISDMSVISAEKNRDPIIVIISSEGGNAEYGNGCIRAIRDTQANGLKVIGSVYGQAMSMAFFILQACDERIMGKLDIIMAHGLTATSVGDMRNREAEDRLLKFYQVEYSKLIANRCKKRKNNIEWWKKLLSDNTPRFFTSSESLELGLVDKIE
jgi:ATP-dependent protease ClpP protease subunit